MRMFGNLSTAHGLVQIVKLMWYATYFALYRSFVHLSSTLPACLDYPNLWPHTRAKGEIMWQSTEQTPLERQDFSCTYLAQQGMHSVNNVYISQSGPQNSMDLLKMQTLGHIKHAHLAPSTQQHTMPRLRGRCCAWVCILTGVAARPRFHNCYVLTTRAMLQHCTVSIACMHGHICDDSLHRMHCVLNVCNAQTSHAPAGVAEFM